ncbi:hypothetical protein [Mesorhizobium sp. A556]
MKDDSPEQGKIPAAAGLLADIFITIRDRPFSQKGIVASVAEMYGFARGELDAANPPGTSCTFRSKADAALDYMYRSCFIERLGKKGPIVITEDGYDFLRELTPKTIRKLSAELEPKTKRLKEKALRTARKPDRSQETQHRALPLALPKALDERVEMAKRLAQGQPTPEERGTVRAAKIASQIPEMPLEKIHVVWTNAQDKLSHPKREFRVAAEVLIAVIEDERERRGPNASSLLPGGGYFRWPTTVAESGNGQLSFEADAFGVLAGAGYRVGRTRGEPETTRRRTLARLFMVEVLDAPTRLEWGAPGTGGRLRKMAYTIAALTRNAKRRGIHMEYAVADWESDLNYLHGTYYVGRFDFPWPETGAG